MKRPIFGSFVVLLFAAVTVLPQQQPPPYDEGRGPGPQRSPPPPMRPSRSPMERMFHTESSGRWWSDPWTAQRIGLTPDQQKKMDSLFQQSRLRLIDLSASLQKEEAILEPLLEPDRPEESRILLQIDRIAQARAELEKANARLLLALRNVLTPDQWKKLVSEHPEPRHDHRPY